MVSASRVTVIVVGSCACLAVAACGGPGEASVPPVHPVFTPLSTGEDDFTGGAAGKPKQARDEDDDDLDAPPAAAPAPASASVAAPTAPAAPAPSARPPTPAGKPAAR